MNHKKLLTIAASIAVSVVFMVGCSTKEQPVLPATTLSVDKSELEVSFYNDDLALGVSWQAVSGATAYFVQFTADSDPEFLKAYVIKADDGRTALDVTYNDMKLIHDATGVISDYKLLIRVLAESEGKTSSYSKKASVNVSMSMWPDLGTVYLCGDAAPCSWTIAPLESAIFTSRNGNMYDIYEWEGELKAAPMTFRINTKPDWFPSVMISAVDHKDIYVAGSDVYYASPDDYLPYTVDEDGVYKVTVDFTDFKNITVEIEKK